MVEEESSLGFTEFPPLVASKGSNELIHNNLETVLHGKKAGGSDSNGGVDSSATTNGGVSNPNSKEWRTLFPPAKPISPQPPMKFIPSAELDGKRVVDYAASDFSPGIKRCEQYVVGFCVGKRLSFPAVKVAVSNHWKLKNDVSIKLHSNCAFIFEFKEDEDRRKVLELGSFYISNCLFTVRPWSNLIESSIASIRTLPIWVLIYNVPLHMWDNEGLSLISSFLGKPLLADEFTINRTRLSYARICVEVDVEFNYPESIPLMIDGKIALEMPVEYQWKPPKCVSCKVFGHSSTNCTKKLKPRWNSKKNGKDVENKDTQVNPANKVVGKGKNEEAVVLGKGTEKSQSRAVEDACDKQQGEAIEGTVGNNVSTNENVQNDGIESQVNENGSIIDSIGAAKDKVTKKMGASKNGQGDDAPKSVNEEPLEQEKVLGEWVSFKKKKESSKKKKEKHSQHPTPAVDGASTSSFDPDIPPGFESHNRFHGIDEEEEEKEKEEEEEEEVEEGEVASSRLVLKDSKVSSAKQSLSKPVIGVGMKLSMISKGTSTKKKKLPKSKAPNISADKLVDYGSLWGLEFPPVKANREEMFSDLAKNHGDLIIEDVGKG